MLPLFQSLYLLTATQNAITSNGLIISQDIDTTGDYRLTIENELIYKVKMEECEKAKKSILGIPE